MTFFCDGAAKFACPRVLDDQKLKEDNQKFRFGCPPNFQIFLEKNILKIIVHTNSLSFDSMPFLFQQIYHFGNLKNNLILNGIKMRATKNMLRTTRFPISVVLRLQTFDSNFATLLSYARIFLEIHFKDQNAYQPKMGGCLLIYFLTFNTILRLDYGHVSALHE